MIKNIVAGLIEQYKTSDPFELCTLLDIRVLIHDLGSRIYGFFQRTEDNYEILHISSNLVYDMQKYICAHELGHAILHVDLSIGFFIENPLIIKSKYEIQADKFAAELLINECNIDTNALQGMNKEQLSNYLRVPKELITYKFNNYK